MANIHSEMGNRDQAIAMTSLAAYLVKPTTEIDLAVLLAQSPGSLVAVALMLEVNDALTPADIRKTSPHPALGC
jgi:hypothetical protein